MALLAMRAGCPGAMVFESSGRAGREGGAHGNPCGLLPSGPHGDDCLIGAIRESGCAWIMRAIKCDKGIWWMPWR
jgi:hypothetical protein